MALHNYTTNYQIPLRLSDALAAELRDVAEATGIQKSKLVRMGLSRLIRDFQSSGLSERMNQISREYEEIV